MLKVLISVFSAMGLAVSSFAQDYASLSVMMREKFAEMVKSTDDGEKRKASDELAQLFEQYLTFPQSFTDSFSEMPNIGVVDSPDGAFRIINWNVPMSDFTHHFEGFVVKAPGKKDGKIRFERLKYDRKSVQKPENKFFDGSQWPGALYYEILPLKDGRKTYYTLLGWQGNDRLTTRKVIEVLDISGREVRFGAPIFKMDKATPKRVIFEYKAEVQMALRYSPKDKMIVFDHLSPINPGMEGNYAFYGPDLTFDGFAWEKGKWVLKSNIDARFMRDSVKRPYSDPRK